MQGKQESAGQVNLRLVFSKVHLSDFLKFYNIFIKLKIKNQPRKVQNIFLDNIYKNSLYYGNCIGQAKLVLV